VSDYDAALARLLGDERAAEEARMRARERDLRAAAFTDATLPGVLLDAAERGDRVAVRTVSGRTLQGHITLVVRDGLVLVGPLGESYLPFAGIASFRTPHARRAIEPTGDRPPPRNATLTALLAELAPERPRVALAVIGEAALLTGELRAASPDIVTITLAEGPLYVAARQVSELTVLASG
jgi:hypothetical protein